MDNVRVAVNNGRGLEKHRDSIASTDKIAMVVDYMLINKINTTHLMVVVID